MQSNLTHGSVTEVHRNGYAMAFVKLDCGILDSTLWVERHQREIFITSLLMAEPYEFKEPVEQIEVRSLNLTGFKAPPGWYGFIPAAGMGIVRRALVDMDEGLSALEKLGAPDPESRSNEFEGRRLIRIDGGYVVLNFMKYRDRDYTAADRMRRMRERRKADPVTRNLNTVTSNVVTDRNVTRKVTHAESREQRADTEAERSKNTSAAPRPIRADPPEFLRFRQTYPARAGSNPWPRALKAIRGRLTEGHTWAEIIAGAERYAEFIVGTGKLNTEYTMQAATFCGPDKHFLQAWDLPQAPQKPKPVRTWRPEDDEEEINAQR